MQAKAAIVSLAGTSLTPAERQTFARQQPFGFILFNRNIAEATQLRALIADLRASVGWHCPILIDQEGGRVQRLRPPLARDYPAAATYGDMAQRDLPMACRAAQLAAYLLGSELAAYGINVNCAPVLDIFSPDADQIIGTRAYSDDPEVIVPLARAVATGLLQAGVQPIIKHIPGHGRANADSHLSLPDVTVSLETLQESDFIPFQKLADLPWAMTAHVRYTALDATRPATLSPLVIGYIRRTIGFNGLLVGDDIGMKALAGSMTQLAQATWAAGCDLVLHCSGALNEIKDILAVAPPLSSDSITRWDKACAMVKQAPPAAGVENATSELLGLLQQLGQAA